MKLKKSLLIFFVLGLFLFSGSLTAQALVQNCTYQTDCTLYSGFVCMGSMGKCVNPACSIQASCTSGLQQISAFYCGYELNSDIIPSGSLCCCPANLTPPVPGQSLPPTTSTVTNNGNNNGASALPVSIENPLEGSVNSPQQLVGRIIDAILGVIGSLALLMFIYGGLMWMTAGGNDQQIKKGRDALMWAAVGLVIIFLSYVIVRFLITDILGA